MTAPAMLALWLLAIPLAGCATLMRVVAARSPRGIALAVGLSGYAIGLVVTLFGGTIAAAFMPPFP